MTDMNCATKISATEHSIGAVNTAGNMSSMFLKTLEPKSQRMEALLIETND